jgi:hypothetical protein
VNVAGLLHRHPAVRWLVPAGVVAVAALAVAGVFRSHPTASALPAMSPDALVAAVRSTPNTSFSGTVVSDVSLGLPEVPGVVTADDSTSMASLLSGSHTLRVWYGGRRAQRIALLGATDETDLFRSGRQLWQWSSSNRVAVHTVLPAAARRAVLPVPNAADPATMTPSGIARGALQVAAPSTRVSIGGELQVADRSAYELVLTPRTPATRVGSIHIAIDGATKVPLGVQVYPRGSSDPAVDLSFTSIRFGSQAASNFSFAPPPGATVHHAVDAFATNAAGRSAVMRLAEHVQVRGSGWASVLRYSGDVSALRRLAKSLRATPVAGSWGTGRLLETPLVCALVMRGGRAYVGAVDPTALFAAAAAD